MVQLAISHDYLTGPIGTRTDSGPVTENLTVPERAVCQIMTTPA